MGAAADVPRSRCTCCLVCSGGKDGGVGWAARKAAWRVWIASGAYLLALCRAAGRQAKQEQQGGGERRLGRPLPRPAPAKQFHEPCCKSQTENGADRSPLRPASVPMMHKLGECSPHPPALRIVHQDRTDRRQEQPASAQGAPAVTMASACAPVVAPATGTRASSTRRTPAVSSSSRVAARWHTRQVFPAVERSELCRRL